MRGRTRPKGPNPLTRAYESNGPDVKVRGTAQHIADKYSQLARDAQSSGDPVSAENYLQHAEHYYRLIAAAQEQFKQQYGALQRPFDDDGEEGDEEGGPVNGYGYGNDRQGGQMDESDMGPASQPYATGERVQQPRYDRGDQRQDRGDRPDRNDRGQRYERPERPYQDRGDRQPDRNARNGSERPYAERNGQDRQTFDRGAPERSGQERGNQERNHQERAMPERNNVQDRGTQDRGPQDRNGNYDRNGPQERATSQPDRTNGADRNPYEGGERQPERAERRERPQRANGQDRNAPRSERAARTDVPRVADEALDGAANLPAFLTNPVRPPAPPVGEEAPRPSQEALPLGVPEAGSETSDMAPVRAKRRPRVRRTVDVIEGLGEPEKLTE